jgi:hypothetical protein
LDGTRQTVGDLCARGRGRRPLTGVARRRRRDVGSRAPAPGGRVARGGRCPGRRRTGVGRRQRRRAGQRPPADRLPIDPPRGDGRVGKPGPRRLRQSARDGGVPGESRRLGSRGAVGVVPVVTSLAQTETGEASAEETLSACGRWLDRARRRYRPGDGTDDAGAARIHDVGGGFEGDRRGGLGGQRASKDAAACRGSQGEGRGSERGERGPRAWRAARRVGQGRIRGGSRPPAPTRPPPPHRPAPPSRLVVRVVVVAGQPLRRREEVGPVVVLEVEQRVEVPVQDGGEVRDLVEELRGRVRQDSPGRPPARSTANSSRQEGQVTATTVRPSVLTRR